MSVGMQVTRLIPEPRAALMSWPADMSMEARVYVVLVVALALAFAFNTIALRSLSKSVDRAERNEATARRAESRERDRATWAEARAAQLQQTLDLWQYPAQTVTDAVAEHYDSTPAAPRHAGPDATQLIMGRPPVETATVDGAK